MLGRTLIGVCAVAAITAGTVTYLVADDSTATLSSTRPDPGKVRAHALRDLPGDVAARGAGQQVRGLPAAPSEPFSLLGVTWDRPRTELEGTVRIRTRDAASGAWSRWRALETHTADAPDNTGPRGRGGTTALWVGPSDGVEVRVAGKALPAGLRVDLIDPGTGRSAPAPRTTGTTGTTGAAGTAGAMDVRLAAATTAQTARTAQTVQTAAAPRPAMVARSQWGADESLVTEPPTYDTAVKAAFVHHTNTGNDYTCDQSAAVVRSVFLYHVKSQGWADIGYNFLVDKCGTVFEGRAGGADRPVHGAHTYGFNTDTTGIAVLGTYTASNDPTTPGVAPAQAALDGTAKVAAWKLGLTGVDPTGTTTLTSLAPNGTGGKYPYGTQVSFKTISGHRDGFATACPGDQLYGKLGAVRTAAKEYGTAPATLATTLTGANKVGTRYYTKSAVTLGWEPATVASYEVLVDGAVAARPDPSATSAAVTLAPGAHTVRLRAKGTDGTTAESTEYPVTADASAPVFGTPSTLYLRRTTVNLTAVPVTLSWKVADNTLLTGLKATSPAAKTFTTATTSWAATSTPGTAQNWSLLATDAAGNTAASTASRTSALIHETSAVRTGTWKTTTTSSYLGGRGLYSSAKGAGASWTFTGRTAGLIVKRASNLGAVHVYVDGVKLGTLDTRASTTAYRQLIWTRTWSTSGKHTIKIVVAGTSGRPTVGIDGIAYIR
ncbi:hypothetical protein GCM10023085_10680 [Actinomadura viridis]|uniref:Peptidoglycan recognition protein family domain-containing protein n=1 Tax=Actinomadura viridis TaxID=58110 RepID=A0A931GQS8_9ACTN|nr:peptidoglycan recognition protein [Actinomadura viridis]MBG6092076.1 hypothetical protein [Actinomadura viridis]